MILCIHLVCTVCKCCFLSLAGRLSGLLHTMEAPWQPQIAAVVVAYAILATGATWLIARACNSRSSKVIMQHKSATRIISLSVAAAQASALICTDWATAFYSLLLLVPLLSWPQTKSCYKMLNWAHVLFSLMILVLIFCACLSTAAFQDFALLLENTHGHGVQSLAHSVDRAGLNFTFMLSWRTTSISAILTFLLPACIVVLLP